MMKRFIHKIWNHWLVLLKDRAYRISLISAVLLFILGMVLHDYVNAYNDSVKYLPVGDLILDNIPTINLEYLFTWGFYFIITLIVLYPLFFRQEIVPFALKTYALLIIVRLGFITLTHVGPPVGFFYDGTYEFLDTPFDALLFRNDLFFSGHVSFTFMGYLLYRESKQFKWFLLWSTFVMACTVLFMHVHYSIDVFAAFFITYGIYALSNKLFNNLNMRFKERLRAYGKEVWKKRFDKLKGKG